MRKAILPIVIAAIALAGCAGRHERVGVNVAVGGPDYYDGYYDGFYGPFHDGYWGNDGAFWYSDGSAWHRDEGHHFGRSAGNGGNWNHIHGTGMHRDH